MKLGLSLALAICLHDIPEGISMAVPMKNGGMKISKVIFYVILSGITTGIGAFFGAIIGSISEQIIAICLSFAARCYVIHCIRRISARGQSFIPWKNDSHWKYDRIFNWNFCNRDLEIFLKPLFLATIRQYLKQINTCEKMFEKLEILLTFFIREYIIKSKMRN